MIKGIQFAVACISGLLALMMIACAPPADIPERSSEPAIHILGLSQDTIVQFVDSLVLLLEYDDIEGDIGTVITEERSLSIKDSRLPQADLFHIPPLAPLGDTVHIRGTLRIGIPQLYLLSKDEEEELTFRVRLRDRAGNWSAEAISPSVLIIKD
ncbi:MAG: hypothetical protein AAF587_26785 [Bacteroidota bacterium]